MGSVVAGTKVVHAVCSHDCPDSCGVLVTVETRVGADGSLGEVLRSGSLGNALRDKIREALLKAIQKNSVLEAVVPAPVRQYVTIQSIAFADSGTGQLELDLAGRAVVPGASASSVLDQFRNRR